MLRAVLIATISVTVLAAACGGGDGGGGSDESPLLRLLAAIPDTEDTASLLTYTDFEAYYDAFGVNQPPANASSEEFQSWATAALSPTDAPFLPLGSEFPSNAFNEAGAYQDELGIDPAGIGQAIQAGRPPAVYSVLLGNFDAERIDDTVRKEPNFSDLLEEASFEDVDYYTWGDDFAQDFSRVTPVRKLGRGGRLALIDDMFMWCLWTEGMTGMIDASSGATDSLADREDIRAMAIAADNLGLYFFEAYGVRFSDESAVLDSYSAIAYGAGVDTKGRLVALIIANDNEESAQETTKLVRERIDESAAEYGAMWSDMVEWSEASTDGLLTIATFRGSDVPLELPLSIIKPRSEP